MMGWIVSAIIWGLGTVIVFRLSNDPLHRLLAPVWPITLVFVLLTTKK